MSTYMPKAGDINRKWYILDAAGKPLGRVAAKAAALLRGKHKVDFTPHVDGGDYVIVINCDKAILTGKKLDQKIHYSHSGYIGHLKQTKYSQIMSEKPEFAMTHAVTGMLPHNVLGRNCATRLRVFAGDKHSHEGQTPQALEF